MSSSLPLPCVKLASPSAYAKSLGLRRGDLVIALDCKINDLTDDQMMRLMRNGNEQPRPVTLRRGQDDWTVLCKSDQLGHLARFITDAPLPELPDIRQQKLKNWDVLIGPNDIYDLQKQSPALLGLIPPLYLIQMRLWTELAVWAALTLLCIPFGLIAAVVVQLLLAVYFWRKGPIHVRQDRSARGFVVWRLVAAPNETAIHSYIKTARPDLQFVYARPVPEPMTETV